MRLVTWALVIATFLMQGEVSAARLAPKPVPPLLYAGMEYRAPHERMGHVEAWDIRTGKRLWENKVYSIWVPPWGAREDSEYVFITGLHVEGSKLIVTNEAGREYKVDLHTGAVDRWSPLLVSAILAAVAVTLAAGAVWWLRWRRHRRQDAQ